MRTPGTWLIRASPFLVILRPSPLDHPTIPLIFATFIYFSMTIDSIDPATILSFSFFLLFFYSFLLSTIHLIVRGNF